MNMTILQPNLITADLLTATSNSEELSKTVDRKSNVQYKTSGQNSATSQMSIVWSGTSITIDRIVLENINWKRFRVIYRDANTVTGAWTELTLTSDHDTTVAHWTQNSATNIYIKAVETKEMDRLALIAWETIVANEEKKIGQFWAVKNQFSLEHNPSLEQYQSSFGRKEFLKNIADGGISQYPLNEYFQSNIELTYQSDSMTSELSTIYNQDDPFVFVPWPTITDWSGEIYEVNWIGDYNFIQPSKDDYSSYGWSGSLQLRETPK